MLNPHWKTLYNYLENLTPRLNENLKNSIRDVAATEEFSWMFDLIRFKSKPRQYRGKWINRGEIEPIRSRQEGKATPMIQLPDVTEATMTTALWGDQFPVTDEYLYYADLELELIPRLQTYVEDFAQGIIKRQSLLVQSIYLDAFDGNIYLGSDNKPLCALGHTFDHGESNLDNAFHLPLSLDSLIEMRNSRTWIDGAGIAHLLNYDTLIVGPDKEDEARVILNSQQYPNDARNAINPWLNRMRLVVVPFLIEDVATGASQYHFMLDSRQHTIEMWTTREPSVRLRGNPANDDVAYERKADFNADWFAARGIVGSTGAGS